MDAHQPVVVDEFKTSISDLPEEILMTIFSLYIDTEGRRSFLKNVMPVCKEWERISSASTFWKRIDSTLFFDDLFVLGDAGLLTYTQHLCLTLSLKTMWKDIPVGENAYDATVWVISRCNDLKSLDLSFHAVSRKLFSFIAENCPNLEDLVLQHTAKFSSYGYYWKLNIMEPIFCCCSHSLKSINFDHCKLIFSSGDLESIADSCHSLEEFHFYFSSDVFYDSVNNRKYPKVRFPVAKFHAGCPNLRILKVGKCYFSCSGAEETEGFPNLIMFGAQGSTFRKDDLSLILRTSTELVTLELCDCSHCPSFCMDLIELPCPKVSKLILSKMCKFISIYLQYLITQWTLTNLALTEFNVNVGKVLYRVLHYNPEPVLESLDLSGSNISLKKLKFIVNQCPKLKNLELQDQSLMRSLPKGFPKAFHSREELQKILEY